MFAKTFEELDAWARSRVLTRSVYRLTATGMLNRDWGLRDQMRRCSVSIMSNIAEGFERESRKEFARFIDIAKGSCGELRAQMYVVEDAGFLDGREAESLRREAWEISRMLAGLKRSLQKGSREA